MFERAGIRWVFGVPSGPVLPLIQALSESPSVDFVLTASETSAGFMAEAVGRLTGIPGVCVSTVGPGATNLATGVGCAYLDRSPVIAITCDYSTRQIGRRTQMWIDHQVLFSVISKSSRQLTQGTVASSIADAISLATSEPPGPVHLDFPEDVGDSVTTEMPALAVTKKSQPNCPSDLAQCLQELIARASRPLVVTGLSFTRTRHPELLLEFIENQRVPFATTLHAKGFLPESHPASLGVIGRARRTDLQRMINRSDLILAVGFDPIEIDYEDWAINTPVIHLDPESVQDGTAIDIAYEGTGDLDSILEALVSIPSTPNEWTEVDWEYHKRSLAHALRPASPRMATHHVLDELRTILPADAILTYDIGAHTHQIATQWATDLPHTAISTNGWSSMGYGMPACYAAKLVHPERIVVGVVGDGCFQMTVGELATARRLGLAVPVIVLNDGWLGLMKVKQERSDYTPSGAFLGEPPNSPTNYFGVPVRSAHDLNSFRAALSWALTIDGPSVIEAFVDVEPYSQTVFDV